ncbi:uncharacterized protein K452DRAFT_64982 [Aplosporella prunicola CBS 121167]|uniref:Uncharacterized protein n=1 Tax=Aplosporella prunicola CBS 121167 TaxID=1176127 RepID=A0A6A6BA08_9PEZI|nr:uncharacterized protein K452DRAFT_64982 [Aplosporella prunicola CBS 121167]KAF2139747.1 hypothetical protein K452DRAFT_64982 [Aplosporella prunicola CBS 121167]
MRRCKAALALRCVLWVGWWFAERGLCTRACALARALCLSLSVSLCLFIHFFWLFLSRFSDLARCLFDILSVCPSVHLSIYLRHARAAGLVSVFVSMYRYRPGMYVWPAYISCLPSYIRIRTLPRRTSAMPPCICLSQSVSQHHHITTRRTASADAGSAPYAAVR